MTCPPGPDPVVVLADGEPLPRSREQALATAIDRAPLTVAADGGIAHAHRLDRAVDVLIGDLDSVSAEDLARAHAHDTAVEEHPRDKDATDLELALLHVVEALDDAAPREVLVVGGHGGRSDHLVGNLLLLAAARFASLRLHAWWGDDTIDVVHDALTLHAPDASTVSIVAMHGPAEGVTTSGLRFPLQDARLEPGSTLGISNRMDGEVATVTVARGTLAVITPASDPTPAGGLA